MKVLVAGMVSDVPGQGGATWAVLQYVLGLRRLGHEVVLIEPVRSLERSAQYFRKLARTFALDAILLERDSGNRIELTRRQTDGADVLLNISGVLSEPVSADQLRDALGPDALAGRTEVMIVAPAYQDNSLKFWLSDADDAIARSDVGTRRGRIGLDPTDVHRLPEEPFLFSALLIQQSRQQHEVSNDRRPSVRHEGQRDPRERDDPEHAADDHERL